MRIRAALAILVTCSVPLIVGCSTGALVLEESSPPDASLLELDAGRRHGCALREDGTVVCWGKNQFAQLGDGTTEDSPDQLRPVQGLEDAIDISTGGDFSCAIVRSGRVICWGFNAAGQLGDGSTLSISAARTQVPGVHQALDVAAGADHTCAAVVGGAVRCWGGNHSGQLGDGTRADSVRPVSVDGLDDAESLSAGSGFTCALRRTGRVSCWGVNSLGQLGDGGRRDRANPVEVRGVDELAVIDSHAAMSCAIRTGGSVWCWGADASTRPDRASGPVKISGIDSASDIAVGEGAACAVGDGRVYCWEGFGPAREQRHAKDVAAIAVERRSLCTATSDGELRCSPMT